jgi:hypothetical protein
MFKGIFPFIFVASTFKSSFTVGSKDEGETLWMFMVHQIIFFKTRLENTYESSHWRETLQLLPMY